jgi:mRNA interferase RelE/StbE
MNIELKKSFLRSLEKIDNPIARMKIEQIIFAVEKADSEREILGLRKMKGCKKGISYRIKANDYRIGVLIEENTVIFKICAHRKDIYKSFP